MQRLSQFFKKILPWGNKMKGNAAPTKKPEIEKISSGGSSRSKLSRKSIRSTASNRKRAWANSETPKSPQHPITPLRPFYANRRVVFSSARQERNQ